MRPDFSAMGDDIDVVAAGILQGIAEHRQNVKVALLMDRPSQLADGAVLPAQAFRADRHLAEKTRTEYAAEKPGLIMKLSSIVFILWRSIHC
jgi:hypothetical protein